MTQNPQTPETPFKMFETKRKKDIEQLMDIMYKDINKRNQRYRQKYERREKQRKIKWQKQFQISPEESEDVAIDGDVLKGSRIYTKSCISCHSLDPSTSVKNTTGPALGLIYGSIAGSDQHFDNYTQGLLNAKLVWTASNLNKFIRNPRLFIPGSKCNFTGNGIPNEQDRTDLIKFMKSYSKEMSKNMRLKAYKFHGKEYVQMQSYSQNIVNQKLRN